MKQQRSHYRIVGTVDQTSRLIRDTKESIRDVERIFDIGDERYQWGRFKRTWMH